MNHHPLKDPIFWIAFIATLYFLIANYGHIKTMNTTDPKKTHIYAAAISHKPNADTEARVYVRAESLAQARTVVANTMIQVARATTDEILDLKREDVIDATQVADPEQATLPLPPATTTAPQE